MTETTNFICSVCGFECSEDGDLWNGHESSEHDYKPVCCDCGDPEMIQDHGHKVIFSAAHAAADAIDAVIADGWKVDYSSQVQTRKGWYSAPLVLDMPEREGWGSWEDCGDGWQNYQTRGDYGVIGSDGSWVVVHADDGEPVVSGVESNATARKAMDSADRLDAVPRFKLVCDGHRINLDSKTLEEAREEASDSLREGLNVSLFSIFESGRLIGTDEDGNKIDETVWTQIDPEEPQVRGHEHSWYDAETVCRSGGYLCTSRCECGWSKVTTIGDTNPVNGNQATTIRYHRGEDE